MTCIVCDKDSWCRGLCQAHYTQARRGQISMPPKIRKSAAACTLCGTPEYALGFCHAHYMQDYAQRNATRLREQRAEYRLENHQEILNAKRDYRENNSKNLADKQRAYAQEHPDIVRRNALQSARTRRARLKDAPTEHISDAEMIARWGADCHICHEPIELDAPRRSGRTGWERSLWRDHVLALVNGGTDTLDNVRPSHAICNLRKGSR